MPSDIYKEVLLLLAGSGLTLVGVVLKSWIDRATTASNRLFEARLTALSEVWIPLINVRRIYAKKIGLGHSRWIQECSDEAEEALNAFRLAVDRSQIILDASVVRSLQDIDGYLFTLLSEEAQRPSVYIREVKVLVGKMEAAVQASMRRRTHQITLDLPQESKSE